MKTATFADADVRLRDLVVSAAALPNPKRTPDFRAEADAFCELSRVLSDDLHVALPRALEIARHLCQAGSAGLSLLDERSGQTFIHWEIVTGELASYAGSDAPRRSTPCGLCLDSGDTILVSRPERAFVSLQKTRPVIEEELVAPLFDCAGAELGTLWIAHHDRGSHFTSADARRLKQLAQQLVLALQVLEHEREREHALALLRSHHTAQRNLLAHDLMRERTLREQAEASESESRQALLVKDAIIHEVNHRAKNTLQIAAGLLYMQARSTSSPTEREALLESHGRLELLAKVHDQLCTNPDTVQTLRMPELLASVCNAWGESFGRTRPGVALTVASDPINLPVEDATAIALVTNEAVTNAYKHAFPEGTSGRISVTLRRAPENLLVLRIVDSGIGLQPGRSEEGMGLQLLRTFAEQLQARLDVASTTNPHGTHITLTIDHAIDWTQ